MDLSSLLLFPPLLKAWNEMNVRNRGLEGISKWAGIRISCWRSRKLVAMTIIQSLPLLYTCRISSILTLFYFFFILFFISLLLTHTNVLIKESSKKLGKPKEKEKLVKNKSYKGISIPSNSSKIYLWPYPQQLCWSPPR